MNTLKYLFCVLPLMAAFWIADFKSFTEKPSMNVAVEELVWHTSVKEATEIANKEDKPLFMFFTGSDWCGWCIRLQKEVFKTPEFVAWAKDKVVLVELDFPRRTAQPDDIKMQNNQLQQMFQVQGYPTVWFAKAETKEGKINFEKLGSSGYVAGGPTVWLDGASKIISNYIPLKKEEPKKEIKPAKSKKKK
jgi:protein disulfide-isomerase